MKPTLIPCRRPFKSFRCKLFPHYTAGAFMADYASIQFYSFTSCYSPLRTLVTQIKLIKLITLLTVYSGMEQEYLRRILVTFFNSLEYLELIILTFIA